MEEKKMLPKELLKKLYRNYLALRLSEERLIDIYYAGKVPGHIHSGLGEEALQAVMLELMEDGDYYSGRHRVLSGTYLTGVPFREFYSEVMGKRPGNARGLSGCNHTADLSKGGLGTSSSLGCDTGVAVGAALSLKRKNKKGKLAINENGDAASSRGPLHEGMALAAAWKVPVLFVCQYNTFGISTDSREMIPVPHPQADRAAGYAMPSEVADGHDVLEIYEKCKKMMDYVRETGKPAVFETYGYRWKGHFEGDLMKYRDADEAAEMMKKDGLKTFEAYLLENGVMTEEEQKQMRDEIVAELDDAVEFAENAPAPTMDDVYELMHVKEEA